MKRIVVFVIACFLVLAFSAAAFAQNAQFDGPLMDSYSKDNEFKAVFEEYLKTLISNTKFVRLESDENETYSAPIDSDDAPLCQRVKRYLDRDGYKSVSFFYQFYLYYIDISADGKNIILTESGK